MLILLMLARANGLNVPWMCWIVWAVCAAARACAWMVRIEKGD